MKFPRIPSLKTVQDFRSHLASLGIEPRAWRSLVEHLADVDAVSEKPHANRLEPGNIFRDGLG